MADIARFWNTWAPYLSYLEDNHLDLDNIKKLSGIISDPVLIIGAGQGLLVEQLLKLGHKVDGVDLSPQMIQYAYIRRGLKLIEADARKLPFANQTYNTTIIATGVVDFMVDESQIGLIVNEARRVTQDTGKVLVAFFGTHPAAERFSRRIGLITGDGVFTQRKIYEMSRLSPWKAAKAIRKETQMGIFQIMREFLFYQMFLPRKEKKASKKLMQMWKQVDNPQALIDAAIESLPYRTKDDIRALFDRLGQPIQQVYPYDSCTVVLLNSKS